PVYFEAQRARGAKMAEFTRKFGPYDAVLIPAAVGEAPSPETTGDPVFNAPWTLLGVPSLTVPVRLSSSGLPLGIQIVATRFGGAAFGRLLNAGMRIDGQ
ncbi:MAG: amidase family protein, partial [Planctomycetota bacterium]|nr:amidase family protein [Planctomycetota bacterium]